MNGERVSTSSETAGGDTMTLQVIATIYNDFHEKFGIPRQSGLAGGELGKIVFEPKYRNPDALRGIEGYSHLWILWQFSEAIRDEWSPTVRPPRLGGNKKMGVFATRSPFRPNPIGLSSVRLVGVEHSESLGDTLIVEGADLLDGTPIYDIKPYLAFTDSHPDAVSGFADEVKEYSVKVDFPSELLSRIDERDREPLMALLSDDPRPSYKGDDATREYGFRYSRYEIFFRVKDGVLTVTGVK